MSAAPGVEWQSVACSYGLVLQTLELCERALRQAGLHRSGSDLQAVRVSFLAARAARGLLQQPLDIPALGTLKARMVADARSRGTGVGGRRQKRAERLPVRQEPQRRRQLTIFDALAGGAEAPSLAAPSLAAAPPLAAPPLAAPPLAAVPGLSGRGPRRRRIPG